MMLYQLAIKHYPLASEILHLVCIAAAAAATIIIIIIMT